jgi:hypothetical protein
MQNLVVKPLGYNGSYVILGNENFSLILFIFILPGYKKQRIDLCWRVYLITPNRMVVKMPSKEDGTLRSYRQFAYEHNYISKGDRILPLFDDVREMIKMASVSNL